MNNVIVTGANGFIGRELVQKLYDEGHTVYSIVRSNENVDELERNSIVITADYRNLSKIKERIDVGLECVLYHLAWQGVNGDDKKSIDVQNENIHIAIKVTQFAHEIGCSKILFAGTVAERALDSLSLLNIVPDGMIYAAAKQSVRVLLDVYCRNIGINHIWMQLSNIYGPTNKTGNIIGYTLGEILNGRDAFFGPAEQVYDLLYIDDLTEAMYRLGCCKSKKHFYFIGSGTPRKLKDYLITTGQLCGKCANIKIGRREDDGIKYDISIFSIDELTQEIGEYVSSSFENSMLKTIKEYQGEGSKVLYG